MKESIKFWLLILLVAILMIILSIFVIYKFQIHKANEDVEDIVIGDNENIVETSINNINEAKINENDIIGKLTIPDILLKDAPIKEGTEPTILKNAIGHFTNTSIYSGNVGFASHNSGESGDYFKNLKNIKIGSEIFYESKYGVKRYIVDIKEIIEETDFSYLQNSDDNKITLITCVSGQKTKRLCIQAKENYENMDYGQ